MKRMSIVVGLAAMVVPLMVGVSYGGEGRPKPSPKAAQTGSKVVPIPDGGVENPTAMPNKPKPSTAMPNKPKPTVSGEGKLLQVPGQPGAAPGTPPH